MSHFETHDDFDLGRLAKHPLLADITYFEESESSNDFALAQAGNTAFRTPHLVLVRRQSRGRGRGGNRWWSVDGALTFSLVLDEGQLPLAPTEWSRLSLIAGLAVARAIEGCVENEPVQLKWPNDVYLRGRKLAGILVESVLGKPARCVLGIGVNVNNSLSGAPTDVAARAVALADIAGRRSLGQTLQAILGELESGLRELAVDGQAWLADFRARCMLTGRSIELAVGERRMAGIASGIEGDGALLLQTATGLQRCYTGVVTRF